MITFDGPNKIIELSSGTTALGVIDLYSRWKDWIAVGNAQYLPAFSPVGGEPIDAIAGTSIPLYAFLTNGWRIKPQEANHTLAVVGGVLLVDGGGDPFVNPTGSFVVRINYQQPVQAITVSTGGGSSPEDVATAVWAKILESGFDASRMLRIIASASAGLSHSSGYRNLANDQDQITGTATSEGNRTSVVYGG